MSSSESTPRIETALRNAVTFLSIAIFTCLLTTGGIWLAKGPEIKMPGPSKGSSPAHWMFWALGGDLDKELRNPTPWFDSRPVVPAWSSGQRSEFARYMEEEQHKHDQMIREIRDTWGPHE